MGSRDKKPSRRARLALAKVPLGAATASKEAKNSQGLAARESKEAKNLALDKASQGALGVEEARLDSNPGAKVNIEELSAFLSAYATALLANGAYTSRIVRCTSRIADRFGYEINMIVWLKHITFNIVDKNNYDNRRNHVSPNTHLNTNLTVISELSALSWHIYDDKVTLDAANRRFKAVMADKVCGLKSGLIFTSLASMGLCKIFEGDIGALLCVFFGTVVGFFLRYVLTAKGLDVRIVLIIASFASSFIAYMGTHLGITSTKDIAIGCSILYLVPGLQIINSLVDVLHEYTLMALSRGANMCMWLTCIAIGVYITLAISKASISNV